MNKGDMVENKGGGEVLALLEGRGDEREALSSVVYVDGGGGDNRKKRGEKFGLRYPENALQRVGSPFGI